MSLLNKIPFFLPLLILFFCLHGYIDNYELLDFKDTLKPGFYILIGTVFTFGLSYYFCKNIVKASLISLFIVGWFIFFGVTIDLYTTLNIPSFFKRYVFIAPSFFFLNILIAFLIKKTKKDLKPIFLYANLLFIIFCAIDVFNISTKLLSKEKPAKEIAINYNAVLQKPDVYLILLDEYPGEKSLRDSFNYDNTDFCNFLRSQDLNQIPITANYNYTRFCMSSMLNLDYVKNDYNPLKPIAIDFFKRVVEIKNASVFKIFDTLGYTIHNNSMFDIQDQKTDLEPNSLLIENKMFSNRFISNISPFFYEKKLSFLPSIYHKDFYATRDHNSDAKRKLLADFKTNYSSPIFSYTHILSPHSPYYYDSLGNMNSFAQITSEDLTIFKDLFISQLKYANNFTKEIILKAKQDKPNSIIILMSDHGFRSYYNSSFPIKANFDNICWVYFPNKNYGTVNQNFTSVNLFRYLFNNQFNQQLPYLKDTTIRIKFR